MAHVHSMTEAQIAEQVAARRYRVKEVAAAANGTQRVRIAEPVRGSGPAYVHGGAEGDSWIYLFEVEIPEA